LAVNPILGCEGGSNPVNNDIVDFILKFITIGSVVTGGIVVYIAVRNDGRQVAAQISDAT
jgi:hypothetical protein